MGIDPLPLDTDTVRILSGVTTATLTTVLLKKGLRNVWMRGARPLRPAAARGRARLHAALRAGARGPGDAGLLGLADLDAGRDRGHAGRLHRRGGRDGRDRRRHLRRHPLLAHEEARVAALVSDGVVRDVQGVMATGLPVWCQGTAAPASVAGLTFVGWQEPVGCGGVAVFPNDVVVADADGAVVIPAALLAEVIAEAVEQERMEAWIIAEVAAGVPLPGLYPPNEETKARYAAWVKAAS
jgi:hypothetical protein